MAKVTLVFAVLLAVLGVAGYYYTGSVHPTALIPLWWGLALGVFGFLAISPSERRRKLFMHINVTLGVAGFLLALFAALNGYGLARSQGIDPDRTELAFKLAMAALLFIYVNFCVKSFLDARRSKED